MASGSVAAVTRSRRHDACLVGKNQFSRCTGAQPSGVDVSGKFRSTVECRSTIRYDIVPDSSTYCPVVAVDIFVYPHESNPNPNLVANYCGKSHK